MANTPALNNVPFRHRSRFGTEFIATRCDFVDGVTIDRPADLDDRRAAADVAEMIGYHATNIRPQLNGFAGYDAFEFTTKAEVGNSLNGSLLFSLDEVVAGMRPSDDEEQPPATPIVRFFERKMKVLQNVNRQLVHDRFQGAWYWYDANDPYNLGPRQGPFDTCSAAIDDAVAPYFSIGVDGKTLHHLDPVERLRCPNCRVAVAKPAYRPNEVSGKRECPNCGYEGTDDQAAWDANFADDRPGRDESHAAGCAKHATGAAECTCGKADREIEEDNADMLTAHSRGNDACPAVHGGHCHIANHNVPDKPEDDRPVAPEPNDTEDEDPVEQRRPSVPEPIRPKVQIVMSGDGGNYEPALVTFDETVARAKYLELMREANRRADCGSNEVSNVADRNGVTCGSIVGEDLVMIDGSWYCKTDEYGDAHALWFEADLADRDQEAHDRESRDNACVEEKDDPAARQGTRAIVLQVTVQVPRNADDTAVAAAVNRCLGAGYEESQRFENEDSADCQLLADVALANVEVAPPIRVGIVCRGGNVEGVATTSDAVEVTLVDHDNLAVGDTLDFDTYPVDVVAPAEFVNFIAHDVDAAQIEPDVVSVQFTFRCVLHDGRTKFVNAPSRYALNAHIRACGMAMPTVTLVDYRPARPGHAVDVQLDGEGNTLDGTLQEES